MINETRAYRHIMQKIGEEGGAEHSAEYVTGSCLGKGKTGSHKKIKGLSRHRSFIYYKQNLSAVFRLILISQEISVSYRFLYDESIPDGLCL